MNDLPDSNIKVAQIYTDQTGMAFHMKRFYGTNTMTYLYFNNFYDPLTEEQKANKKNITIYIRNFNIFREYMPQNIITKYYNLHMINEPTQFPQLLLSFPFSGITSTGDDDFSMQGYNYFIRKENGEVIENNGVETTNYNLHIDTKVYDVKTFRPPRNFWRLNLLD